MYILVRVYICRNNSSGQCCCSAVVLVTSLAFTLFSTDSTLAMSCNCFLLPVKFDRCVNFIMKIKKKKKALILTCVWIFFPPFHSFDAMVFHITGRNTAGEK